MSCGAARPGWPLRSLWRAYVASFVVNLPRLHEAVKHSAKKYVNGQAHTNGIESFWALLKRGYIGTYHHMSEKHLGRYVVEFSGRHNRKVMQ